MTAVIGAQARCEITRSAALQGCPAAVGRPKGLHYERPPLISQRALTPSLPVLSSRPIQIILKDDRGGRGVEFLFPLAPVALLQRQPALGLAAREPLVLGDDRHARARLQLVG